MQNQRTDADSTTRNPVGKTVNKFWGMFSKSSDKPLREDVEMPRIQVESQQFPQPVPFPHQQPSSFQQPTFKYRTDFLCKDFYNPPKEKRMIKKAAEPYEWDVENPSLEEDTPRNNNNGQDEFSYFEVV